MKIYIMLLAVVAFLVTIQSAWSLSVLEEDVNVEERAEAEAEAEAAGENVVEKRKNHFYFPYNCESSKQCQDDQDQIGSGLYGCRCIRTYRGTQCDCRTPTLSGPRPVPGGK